MPPARSLGPAEGRPDGRRADRHRGHESRRDGRDRPEARPGGAGGGEVRHRTDAALLALKKFPQVGAVEVFDATKCTDKGLKALPELPNLRRWRWASPT
jgi:hypothetical protein